MSSILQLCTGTVWAAHDLGILSWNVTQISWMGTSHLKQTTAELSDWWSDLFSGYTPCLFINLSLCACCCAIPDFPSSELSRQVRTHGAERGEGSHSRGLYGSGRQKLLFSWFLYAIHFRWISGFPYALAVHLILYPPLGWVCVKCLSSELTCHRVESWSEQVSVWM